MFSEIAPITYKIAVEKNILQRKISDFFSGEKFATERSFEPLPVVICQHASLIRRRLGGVDMQLQENKAVNLSIAAPKVNGILIRPGEVMSFWRLVGRDSAAKGYKEGMTIALGKPSKGIGGGMCQFTNLIHWMVLHSELTIVEHHHHDGLDLFPDFRRTIPFGTGTSIFYNYRDYRVRNTTDTTFQLLVWTDGVQLHGELRAAETPSFRFQIVAKDDRFIQENGVTFRTGEVIRRKFDAQTDELLEETVIRRNHARVMYKLNQQEQNETTP
ncbi:MAG: VanW family protein [Bacteroidaceae bacterium]|nr:VanW family protein [Bacteroidaceae bacterium]